MLKLSVFFLAEGLRTRKITLMRALEISQKVVENINLIDTEYNLLKFIKELSKDFDELAKLEDRISLYIKSDERSKTEAVVESFVINILSQNAHMALELMEEATKPESSLDQLKAKFPGFRAYLEQTK